MTLPRWDELINDLHHPGRWLGHYTKAATAFEKIVPSTQLLMGAYRNMSDPLETEELPLTATTPGQRRFCEELNRERGRIRIVSLTGDEDIDDVTGCCWAHPRMWQQYGEDHRGVCLVFDRATFFGGKFPSPDLTLLGYRDVKYERDGLADLDAAIGRKDTRRIRSILKNQAGLLFFTKTRDWEAEREVRVIARRWNREDYERERGEPLRHMHGAENDPVPEFLNYRNSLRAVVVGHKFPDWGVEGAGAACPLRVPLLRVDWSTGRPCLRRADGVG